MHSLVPLLGQHSVNNTWICKYLRVFNPNWQSWHMLKLVLLWWIFNLPVTLPVFETKEYPLTFKYLNKSILRTLKLLAHEKYIRCTLYNIYWNCCFWNILITNVICNFCFFQWCHVPVTKRFILEKLNEILRLDACTKCSW